MGRKGKGKRVNGKKEKEKENLMINFSDIFFSSESLKWMAKLFFLIPILLIACNKPEEQKQSQVSQNSLNITIFENYVDRTIWEKADEFFQDIFNCKLDITYKRDLLIEQKEKSEISSEVDIFIGLNNVNFFEFPDTLLLKSDLINLVLIDKKFFFDKNLQVIPFCYNYLSFIYDADIIRNIPQTFGGLQDGDLKKKILLPDPETSSIGRGMLLWSIGLFEVNG